MKTPKPFNEYLSQWRRLEKTLVEDSDFCKELKIGRCTSRRWRRKGLLKFQRINQKVYYRMTDLLPFLRSRTAD